MTKNAVHERYQYVEKVQALKANDTKNGSSAQHEESVSVKILPVCMIGSQFHYGEKPLLE